MSDKLDKGRTQCGGMRTQRGERREMLGAGGTNWGFGGDGDGVMEGTKQRKGYKQGHRRMDVRERRQSKEWETCGTE